MKFTFEIKGIENKVHEDIMLEYVTDIIRQASSQILTFQRKICSKDVPEDGKELILKQYDYQLNCLNDIVLTLKIDK